MVGLGTSAYIISTIGAGGGALLMIPLVNFTLGASVTAPIVNLGAFFGRPSRLWLFRKTIDWKIVLYYLPASASGTLLAAIFFTKSPVIWLQILISLFLISTVLQYRFGKKKMSFHMKRWYFIPLGFFVSLIGTFTGGMGPIQNPFYLNLGLSKEYMIGTKTVNSFFMGIFQFIGYFSFDIITTEILIFGIALGIGATFGNIIGKRILIKISEAIFLKAVLAVMVISGLVMLTKSLMSLLN